ncbi:response regulator [Maricurvus nonylphenolicus]|uniref:response regulator n=1 Tax=Maricurvus nonylphenolicus TaxID=1008307 RepID=UPI0036F2C9EE
MSETHILVVDDHQDIRDLLGSYLSQHGFRVSLANGGEQMRSQLQPGNVDLVVLDIMMPGESGLDLLKELRTHDDLPVIMLTAMSEDADCVLGLEMGADDYVTKPFSPRVLLARIKAVLRRPKEESPIAKPDSDYLRFKGWELDIHQRQLSRHDGVLISLSSAEFTLLKVFLSHPQQVLSRDELLNLTKGRDALPFDRSIDNQISRLRRKIESDPHNPTLIKTIWGGGYMFTEALQS